MTLIEKVYWHTPDRILVVQSSGTLTLDDLEQGFFLLEDCLNAKTTDCAVHVITDVTNRTSVSPELYNLAQLIRVTQKINRHPCLGWFIVVDQEPVRVLQFLATAAQHLAHSRLHVVKTVDKALGFLQQLDAGVS